MIKVGCCGWGYLSCKEYFGNDWKKGYESILQCYAKLFEIVEINSSFYHIPKIETAEKWRKQVDKINKNFEFTVKASRIITHIDKFSSDESGRVFDIYRKLCGKLKARIILLQCPDSWKPSENNTKNFRLFLKKIKDNKIIIAWEPRGEWWNNLDLVKEICRDFNLIHCVDPFRVKPQYFSSKKVGYFRLHGFGKPTMYSYDFSDRELNELKGILNDLGVKDSYVFFNNMTMYENALGFGKIVK